MYYGVTGNRGRSGLLLSSRRFAQNLLFRFAQPRFWTAAFEVAISRFVGRQEKWMSSLNCS